jgi:2-C-methyl-D-erythritol 4-phosphate cytidylyltransferase
VRRCFEAAEQYGAAVPVIPLIDSIRRVDATGSQSADRNAFCLVQTPQTFRLEALKKAYETEESPSFTDDASVWECQGLSLTTVAGNPENIKITRLFDLRVAEALMA